MHRAVCRAIRGACRKVREDCPPALSGEEVRQQNSSKDEFVPPKYTWTDAIGWTAGIVLSYEFIHRRRGLFREDSFLISASPGLQNSSTRCPFRLSTVAIAQPVVSTVNNVFTVDRHHQKSPTRKSIDVTPFIYESEALFLKDESFRHSFDETDDDDGLIQFDETVSKVQHAKRTGPKDFIIASTAEKISGDIFGALGAFRFLKSDNMSTGEKEQSKSIVAKTADDVEKTEMKMSALELMEKGAELGSSRSLYNLGVGYDRLNETKIATEYYKRASDLGHPLASYNLGVLTIKDGKVGEGLKLMHFAAERGVEEAKLAIQSFRVQWYRASC